MASASNGVPLFTLIWKLCKTYDLLLPYSGVEQDGPNSLEHQEEKKRGGLIHYTHRTRYWRIRGNTAHKLGKSFYEIKYDWSVLRESRRDLSIQHAQLARPRPSLCLCSL